MNAIEGTQSKNKPTFRKREGLSVSVVPTLESVFRIARSAIQEIRLQHLLQPIAMEPQTVRLIPQSKWLKTTRSDPDTSLRDAAGFYETEEHACFIPYDVFRPPHARCILTRWQAAKVLLHEAVHCGSYGGMEELEVLNEGITETYARDIFNRHVLPQFPHVSGDPYETRNTEVKIWNFISESYPDMAAPLRQAFWKGDTRTAAHAIKQNLGDQLCSLLHGKNKTDAENDDILTALVAHKLNIPPGEARKLADMILPFLKGLEWKEQIERSRRKNCANHNILK